MQVTMSKFILRLFIAAEFMGACKGASPWRT